MALARMRIAGFRHDENEFHLFERSGSTEETAGNMPFARGPPHHPLADARKRRARGICRDENPAKLEIEVIHLVSDSVRLEFGRFSGQPSERSEQSEKARAASPLQRHVK